MGMGNPSNPDAPRSSVITEVKAAVSIAVMLLANVIALVYWAATLSSDIRNLQYNVSELRSAASTVYTKSQADTDLQRLRGDIKDHEDRIRAIERKP
jgi:Tfp pilus assembly protein PilO